MLIIRRNLNFDRGFTRIPNAWVRDKDLSLKAIGLLTQLMSHQDGWSVSIQSLASQNSCGRDAIRSAVQELEKAGYLKRSQPRTQSGSFESWIWETCDPALENPAPGKPAAGNPTTKKTIGKKTNQSNGDFDSAFDEFWSIYPRKVGKAQARKAFAKALEEYDVKVITEGARKLAADPNLPEIRFVPYPATWINREGWEDDPHPESAEMRSKKAAILPGKRDWVKALHEAGEHYDCLGGEFDHPADWNYVWDIK